MRGEDLVGKLRLQITFAATFCKELLKTHHDRIGETTQKHDHRYEDIHDNNFFMVYRCEPFVPQVAPFFEVGNTSKNCDTTQDHHCNSCQYDWIVRNCIWT